MLWAIFALLAGLTLAIQSEINKTHKIDGFKLNTFRSLFATLIMLPFFPLIEWPVYPEYYLLVLLEAAISIVCMMVQYNLAARHNGRISCLHQPITIVLTFCMWLAISPDQRAFLIENPINTLFIGISFVIFAVSLQFIRKGEKGVGILMAILPIAVLYSLMMVVSKIILEKGTSMLGISLNYVFLCNIFMFLLSAPVLFSQSVKGMGEAIDKKAIRVAIPVSISHTASWLFICFAIIMTPNPAYPTALAALAPLWFLIYYKVRKIPDDANPMAGLFLGISAIILLLATGIK